MAVRGRVEIRQRGVEAAATEAASAAFEVDFDGGRVRTQGPPSGMPLPRGSNPSLTDLGLET